MFKLGLIAILIGALVGCGQGGGPKTVTASLNPGNSYSGRYANLGFYTPDDPGIPVAVRAAARSVVMVVAPAGTRQTVESIFGRHTIQEIVDRIKKIPLSDRLSQSDKDMMLEQVQACAKAGQPLACEIFDGNTVSTGYIVADGRRVRTAFHAVSDWCRQNLKPARSSLASVSIPVLIYDSSGRLLASLATGTAVAVFPKSNLSNIDNVGAFTLPNDDLVEIQLQRTIGPPLMPAAAKPRSGDPLYVIGYPRKTNHRKDFGALDAPGFQLRISRGKPLSADEVARKEGLNPNELTDETKNLLQQMIVTDADGAPGLSGGPTVNALGQVVGTYTAGYPADGHATTHHISYSSTR